MTIPTQPGEPRWYEPVLKRLEHRVLLLAWLSVIVNILIVATGGAVRLTGSGLGCPTWPRCTEDSLINTPEMGIHGVIEFGNRTLTGLLLIVALAMFLSVVRSRIDRPDLFWRAFAIGIGIIVQAVVGGVTVLLDLNPSVVGVHYMLSAVLVVIATSLLYRVKFGMPGDLIASQSAVWLTRGLVVLTTVAVYLGTLTTGAGPHAGDAYVDRNGLDPELMQHLHSWPSYALAVLTAFLLFQSLTGSSGSLRRAPISLFTGVLIGQIALGIAQSRMGLPVLMVGIHMVAACILLAVLTWVVHSNRARVNDESAVPLGPDVPRQQVDQPV